MENFGVGSAGQVKSFNEFAGWWARENAELVKNTGDDKVMELIRAAQAAAWNAALDFERAELGRSLA
jgi:hypothetical protein